LSKGIREKIPFSLTVEQIEELFLMKNEE